MTGNTALDRAERVLRIVSIAKLVSLFPLLVLAVVFALVLPDSGIAPIVAILAVASRLVLGYVELGVSRHVNHLGYLAAGRSRWWFDPRTRAVEEGEHSRLPLRDGPYATREDAERAPQIARERAARWNAED